MMTDDECKHVWKVREIEQDFFAHGYGHFDPSGSQTGRSGVKMCQRCGTVMVKLSSGYFDAEWVSVADWVDTKCGPYGNTKMWIEDDKHRIWVDEEGAVWQEEVS